MAYDASSIQVLEGLDPVRKRPGMYIGSTGSKGLHHLVWEVIDNSIDEHMAGECNKIIVTLNSDGSVSVEDNGRGIPVGLHENTRDYPKETYPKGICAERIILTVLHSGGKFDESHGFSGGLHGVGISVVNALSKKLLVEVFSNGKAYCDEYRNGGTPVTRLKGGELISKQKTKKRGTKITFWPDETIFETITFKPEVICKRLKELAYLNKGLELIYVDANGEVSFKEENGILGFLRDINKGKELAYEDIVYITGSNDNCQVEFAMQHLNEFSENFLSFCNNINTFDGGTHVTGAKTALTKIINKFTKQISKGGVVDGQDIRNGLSCILSIRLKNPQFDGQTKSKLGNTEAKKHVEEIMGEQLELYFDKNLELIKTIIELAQRFNKARANESKSREAFLKKESTSVGTNKLAACQKKNNPAKGIFTELYIVEGDSAGGSAKQGRDRKYQAILPLWGKMLNVEKSSEDQIYSNEKLLPIVSALGTGIGEDFNIDNLKYDKIIIMADADVDGSHIQTLLLTFFFRHMRKLIDCGHVYLATPPLYKIVKGKKVEYFYDDKDLKKFTSKQKVAYTVQRFKGLGEMTPSQLWETTMNPETRILKQIELDNIIDAEQITTILMGTKVPPRRKFIEDNAHKASIIV